MPNPFQMNSPAGILPYIYGNYDWSRDKINVYAKWAVDNNVAGLGYIFGPGGGELQSGQVQIMQGLSTLQSSLALVGAHAANADTQSNETLAAIQGLAEGPTHDFAFNLWSYFLGFDCNPSGESNMILKEFFEVELGWIALQKGAGFRQTLLAPWFVIQEPSGQHLIDDADEMIPLPGGCAPWLQQDNETDLAFLQRVAPTWAWIDNYLGSGWVGTEVNPFVDVTYRVFWVPPLLWKGIIELLKYTPSSGPPVRNGWKDLIHMLSLIPVMWGSDQ